MCSEYYGLTSVAWHDLKTEHSRQTFVVKLQIAGQKSKVLNILIPNATYYEIIRSVVSISLLSGY